jgi:hypothetical protein
VDRKAGAEIDRAADARQTTSAPCNCNRNRLLHPNKALHLRKYIKPAGGVTEVTDNGLTSPRSPFDFKYKHPRTHNSAAASAHFRASTPIQSISPLDQPILKPTSATFTFQSSLSTSAYFVLTKSHFLFIYTYTERRFYLTLGKPRSLRLLRRSSASCSCWS